MQRTSLVSVCVLALMLCGCQVVVLSGTSIVAVGEIATYELEIRNIAAKGAYK